MKVKTQSPRLARLPRVRILLLVSLMCLVLVCIYLYMVLLAIESSESGNTTSSYFKLERNMEQQPGGDSGISKEARSRLFRGPGALFNNSLYLLGARLSTQHEDPSALWFDFFFHPPEAFRGGKNFKEKTLGISTNYSHTLFKLEQMQSTQFSCLIKRADNGNHPFFLQNRNVNEVKINASMFPQVAFDVNAKFKTLYFRCSLARSGISPLLVSSPGDLVVQLLLNDEIVTVFQVDQTVGSVGIVGKTNATLL